MAQRMISHYLVSEWRLRAYTAHRPSLAVRVAGERFVSVMGAGRARGHLRARIRGTAKMRCIDCTCSCDDCIFDTHRASSATVTAFVIMYTNATGQCTLRVSAENPAKEQAILQKVIVGLNDFRTHWLRGLALL